MANVVIMPRQGQSVESCLIASVNKKKGDSVDIGDVLFSYETDKSSFEENAQSAGIVLEVFINEGDDVPCLDPVMIIGEAGEDISRLLAQIKAQGKAIEEITSRNEKAIEMMRHVEENAIVSVVSGESGEMKISPRARNYAEKAKADLSKAVPTGPNGRIIERDVIELVNQGYRLYNAETTAESKIPETSAAQETVLLLETTAADYTKYTEVKLPNIRKIIAKSMHQSLSTMAQLTLNSSFDASAVMQFRKALKDNAQALGLENITINDIVLYATAKTLKNHKDLNAHYLDDVIRYFDSVNLGVAVDTDRGLLVPTLFGADSLSLNELSKAAKNIVSQAQKGTIDPDLLKGGTFTVTNLGTLGIESFTPVINPPQTGILGVNNITRRVKQVNGEDVFYDCMSLSLTFDHRALDGAPAARFLKELCANLENFNLLLAK